MEYTKLVFFFNNFYIVSSTSCPLIVIFLNCQRVLKLCSTKFPNSGSNYKNYDRCIQQNISKRFVLNFSMTVLDLTILEVDRCRRFFVHYWNTGFCGLLHHFQCYVVNIIFCFELIKSMILIKRSKICLWSKVCIYTII